MSQQKPCFEVPPLRRKRDNVHESLSAVVVFDDVDSMDAAGYLSRVRAQARRLPEISEAYPAVQPRIKRMKSPDEVITGSAASLHYMLSSSSSTNGGIQPPPTLQHVPACASQWVDQTMASFSQLRRYLEQCQSQGVGRDKSQRILVPPMKDGRGWYTFCVGGVEYDDEDDKSTSEDAIPAWRKDVPAHGYTPTVSLLLQLDQVMVRRVLGHLTDQFCQNQRRDCCRDDGRLEEQQQQQRLLSWLYALTARLERPIHRDDAVTLYTLLKALTAARTTTSIATQHRRALATINVLIVVVGIYLEQGGGYANVMEVKV